MKTRSKKVKQSKSKKIFYWVFAILGVALFIFLVIHFNLFGQLSNTAFESTPSMQSGGGAGGIH